MVMKQSVSAYDLHIIASELNALLVKAKIEQIYLLSSSTKETKELLIEFYVQNTGKKTLLFKVPECCYFLQQKPETPQTPHGFVIFLRKRLKHARLKAIQQLDFERIITFTFETKEQEHIQEYTLVVEFIPPGNIILCDATMKIISPLETQEWKDRTIKPNRQYLSPKKEYNFLTITEKELSKLITTSDKESIVKILAIDLGLGGKYAEHLCKAANVAKDKKKLTTAELNRLSEEIVTLRVHKITPVLTEGGEILPFKLNESDRECKPEDAPETPLTFIEAISNVIAPHAERKKQAEKESIYTKVVDKQQKIIDMQTKQKYAMLEEIELSTKKGEAIYSNYQIVKDILEQLKKARITMPWKEIKEKLKGHKVIKELNEKNNEIVVEL